MGGEDTGLSLGGQSGRYFLSEEDFIHLTYFVEGSLAAPLPAGPRPPSKVPPGDVLLLEAPALRVHAAGQEGGQLASTPPRRGGESPPPLAHPRLTEGGPTCGLQTLLFLHPFWGSGALSSPPRLLLPG